MKLRWLLPGFLGVFLFSYPAEAAKLQFWRFDADQRRLVFTTDGGVQPRAQMITNPTRLIIDLPGINLERPKVNQIVGQTIRAIRIAQFDRQVTRLVIELAPGYTLDPQQIRVRGESPTQWSVQLPNPQALPQTTSPAQPTLPQAAPPPRSTSGSESTSQAVRAATSAGTQVDNIRVMPDGFFIQTRGGLPEVEVDRSRNKKQIHVDLKGAALGSRFTQQTFSLNRLGVSRLQVAQTQSSPPIARVTLNVDKESPNWRATVSSLGGVVLLPQGGVGKLPGERPSSSYYLLTSQPSQVSSKTSRSSQVASSRVAQAPVQRTTDVPVPLPPISNPTLPPDTSPQPFPQPSRSYPDERVVVVIDIGHGGKDVGAIGIGGLWEKDVILPIGLKVAEILKEEDIEVVLPRSDDRFVDLAPRVALAKRANADVFVSIHANAINLSRQDISGLETYYYSPGGARLARVIHNTVLEKVGVRDRGVRKANFYVIKRSPMPATLVEVGFVTGAEDAPKLRDSGYQEEMAEAIARGILQYLQIDSD